MLNLYRSLLRLRRSEPGLQGEELTWLPAPEGVIAFARGAGFIDISNLSPQPISLPAGAELLLASSELIDGRLPVDATAWLRVSRWSHSDQWRGWRMR
jgi:alpha-glucosidase